VALRELLLPWDAQPQEAARLSPEYADAVVYLPSVNPGALLNGVALTQGAPLAITNGGIAVAQQQRAKVNHSVTKLPNSAPNVTMFMVVANGAAYNNTASDRGCLGVDSGGTFLGYQSWMGGLTFTAGVYYSPDYTGAISTDAAAVRQGHVQCVVATYVRNDMLRIYVDGTLYGSVAAGNYDCGLNPGGANAWAAGNSTTPLTGSLLCGGVMARALSDTDARDLSLRGFGALFEPRRIHVPVAAGGGGTTVALSGISATFAQTAPAVSSATPLVGESVTANAGILLPAFSRSLSGQAGTAFAGTLNTSTSRALSGQSAAFTAGSVIPSVAIAAIGLQATFASGTLTASSSSGTTVNLVGEPVAFAQTAPSVNVTIALTGIAATMASGLLSASSGTAIITVKAGSWLRYKKLQ